jgi:hypothetical protein
MNRQNTSCHLALKSMQLGGVALALLVSASGCASSGGSAQEQEAKKWKEKARGYVKTPLALRDNQEGMEAKIGDLTRKNGQLAQQLADAQTEGQKSQASQAELDRMKQENAELRTAYEAQKSSAERDITPGIIFKVQIGAFQYFDLTKYFNDKQNFEGETQASLNRYTLGRFRDYDMAEAFRKDMAKLGIRDAFVVALRDGVRITIKEGRAGAGSPQTPAESATPAPPTPAKPKRR